jgi:hypothetical protein
MNWIKMPLNTNNKKLTLQAKVKVKGIGPLKICYFKVM